MNNIDNQERQILETEANHIVLTNCGICNANCGMKISFANGHIVKVEGQAAHPVSKGYLCPKGKAIRELVEAPDRLKRPLRKTVDGQWQEISWNEAFELIAEELKTIKASYGAEAVAVHVGQAGVGKEFTPYVERFCQVFGTPNFSTAGSQCHQSRAMANTFTYGVFPKPDYENSSCIVLWGYNPPESCPPLMNDINKARRQGAKLIVIDPRRTSLASKADFHLQLRPGTDGALALGMLHVIIKEELYDQAFVDNWTSGFGKLAAHIEEYTPERVEKITKVPASRIEETARLYARTSPACIAQGNALELHSNGFQAARAVSMLQAVTGNLDITGGAVFAPPLKLTPLRLRNHDENPKQAIGQKQFPLFYKYTHQAQANIYTEAILAGKPYPLKGMIITGSNPVLTWPNAGKVKRALASIDFLVVVDNFMTETAKLADIVIPASTFLERDELWNWSGELGESRLVLAPRVATDEGLMTNWKFWIELAGRMGYGDYFPWATEEAALNDRVKPLGFTLEGLRHKPDGIIYSVRTEKKYERTGFKTPSGKVEFYSDELKSHGYDPLPIYQEPDESPVSVPGLFSEYPFILTSGARTLGYFHSRYRNLTSLRKIAPEPLVEIHEDKARALGITDGDTVIVESTRGRIELKAKLSAEIHPDVIFIPHGWDEANVNLLTDNESLDPITGFPPYRSLLVRVSKKTEQKSGF
ncbi:MAG: molybdopterin-dependent oxidoreductase [Desulfotomaculaceae bacterium]|nr:molybdopterin-dependent oxidoreductase [Desulfotomaculaceae bacterium]